MALFIVATLLQREAVELLVPAQAAMVLTPMYVVSGPAGLNDFVQGWDGGDLSQAMRYIGLDLVVEALIFVATVLVLWRVYPEFSPARILDGLLTRHFVAMLLLMFVAWPASLDL